jgi:hypothetical protein
MARDFTKNLANYVSLGNLLGAALDGLAAFSVSAIINWDTVSAVANDNTIVCAIISGTTVGFSFGLDGAASAGNARIRATARSASGDTRFAQTGTSNIPVGVWTQVGCVVDVVNDAIHVFVDGVLEASNNAATFSNTTWVLGAPTESDAIGSYAPGGGAAVTTAFFDGQIAEVGLWGVNIAALGMAQLGARLAPYKVMRQNLLGYWPLDDRGTTILPDYVGRINGTVTGSIPATDHPRVFR